MAATRPGMKAPRELVLRDVDATAPAARPGRKSAAVAVKFLRQNNVFHRPVCAVHFPFADIQLESQLLQLLSAKEWVDRVKFVFNTNLPLARGDILDQPKQGTFAVNCLISKNAGVASQLVTCAGVKPPY